jgi:hypothetical protein
MNTLRPCGDEHFGFDRMFFKLMMQGSRRMRAQPHVLEDFHIRWRYSVNVTQCLLI